MDHSTMERLMSNLDLGGTSPEENVRNLMSMNDMERSNFLGKLMTSSISMFECVKLNVGSDQVPLARIRDKYGAPFENYMCAACGKESDQSTVFLQCGRCKSVKYCNKQCQKRDWIGQGIGPTRPRKHKDLCTEFFETNREFQSHPTAGISLRTLLFSSWADQHHENGCFFIHEFLARQNILGGAEVGFWAMQDSCEPYQKPMKDMHGFLNGQMLLGESYPTMAEGWTSSLNQEEFPSSDPPSQPPPKGGLKSWEEYMEYRNIAPTSISPLLLTNILTVYRMICHELKLPEKGKKLSVYLLGVEVELNQIPLFGELVYLLPNGVELELILQSSAAKAICKEAKSLGKNSILEANKYVLNVVDPVGKRRVRVKVDGEYECFHYVPNFSSLPDAVLGLNAGLGSYPTWPATMQRLIQLKIPFSFSDQTKTTLRFVQLILMPEVVQYTNKHFPNFPPIAVPRVQISLNPFHGIVGRDVAAVLVPNLNNGYFLTCSCP